MIDKNLGGRALLPFQQQITLLFEVYAASELRTGQNIAQWLIQ
jgi:hypothetical protein